MAFLKKTIFVAVGWFAVSSSTVLAQEAQPNDFGVPRLAHETRAELVALGCDEVAVTDEQALLAGQAMNWQVVLPIDAPEQSVLLCSPEVINNLQPLREGQVEAMTAHAQEIEPLGFPILLTGGRLSGLFGKDNPIAKTIVWILKQIAMVGHWLLGHIIEAIPALFMVGVFIGHPYVRTTWPFVLGIVNLGFLLALVLIALMVTLRLDDGGGVKRMLPRFLLGALLVNFSLIIGGAIIDASRLVSAAMISVMGIDSPAGLVNTFKVEMEVVESVMQLSNTFAAFTNEWSDSLGTGQVLAAIIMVLIVWSLAGAALVVYVGLLVRYFALLILLVLSPFAYLFVAFPNTVNLAKLWWKHFLKYAFYGPAVLMILIATVKIAGDDALWENLTTFFPNPGTAEAGSVKAIIKTTIWAIGFMIAAGSGRWAGIVGSAAVMGAVSRVGARGKAMYLGGLRKAGRTATTPAREGWKQVKGAAYRESFGNLGAYMGGRWQAIKERRGWDTKSLAARGRARVEERGGPVTKPLYAKNATQLGHGNTAVAAAAANPLTLTPAQLGNRYVGARVARAHPQAIENLALNAGTGVNPDEEVRAIELAVRNKALMGELNDAQKIQIAVNLDRNSAIRGGAIPDDVVRRIQIELNKTMTASPTDNP